MRVTKSKIIIFIVTLLCPQILSAVISGVGYAPTKYEAKKEALADLSLSVKSEVRTHFESSAKSSGAKGVSHSIANIKISSNLPILGAKVNYKVDNSEVMADMQLIGHYSSNLYIEKLKSLNIEIKALQKELKKSKKSTLKLDLYSELYSLLSEYDRYESVALILKAKIPFRPNITKTEVKSEMAKINSNIDSIELAGKTLASEFSVSRIYTYPALLQQNSTVSEFASVLQKELKSRIKGVKTPKEADYILVGEYTLTKNGMYLNYELLNTKTNEVIKSKTIKISPKAYASLETKPKGVDFDALLTGGVVSSNDLKVSLNSNRGSENLLFQKGSEVELFVKLNKMGYLYIVGYTQTKSMKMSYLLELSEGDGDAKFVKFINADDASRWQSLGLFEVDAPYGIESLQVIASNKKITNLPFVKYDQKSEYYVISKDIKKALAKTRGLKKKQSKKVEMSEDVLSFTTMNK